MYNYILRIPLFQLLIRKQIMKYFCKIRMVVENYVDKSLKSIL